MITRINNFIAGIKSKIHINKVLKSIDMEEFKTFQMKYKDASPFPGYSKYLNIGYWMQVKLKEFYKLKLDKEKRQLNILDIGTGAGYFPYICNYFNHKTVSLDLGTIPMYNEITSFLKLERVAHEIKPLQKLPDFGRKFDLITAYSICFNNHNTTTLWNENEWDFFLKDLANNYAKEDCRMLLVFNYEADDTNYSDSLLSFFKKSGGRIYRNRIYFKNLHYFINRIDDKSSGIIPENLLKPRRAG